jgi:hypothetical protein
LSEKEKRKKKLHWIRLREAKKAPPPEPIRKIKTMKKVKSRKKSNK